MEGLDEIEMAIRNTLLSIPQENIDAQWSDGQWTEQVKARLYRLGALHHFHVCASSRAVKTDEGEWLFDMTWIRNEQGRMVSVPLVLECDWGGPRNERLENNFLKLLLARADHRVHIFEGPRAFIAQQLDKFKQHILAFKETKPEDRYLFVANLWGTTKPEFEFDLFLPGSALSSNISRANPDDISKIVQL